MIIVAALGGQAIGFPLTAVDDRKKEIVIPAKPGRIISLVPTHTELLFALGLDKEIVGVTRYCDYPPAVATKEKVAGFIDVDADRIVALKPDLILAFGTMQLPAVAELEKRGLRVFWVYPRSVNEVLDSFERVGKITGREQEARQLRASVEREVTALRKQFAGLSDEKRPRVFRVMSMNTAATIGADNFQTDLFAVAGGRNAFASSGKDYFEMDAEALRKGDPEVMLICGDDEQGLKQKLRESALYGSLTAVKKGSILVMPCELTCRPGPRIAVAAKRLAEDLHPKDGKN